MSDAVRAELAMVGIGSTHHFSLQNNAFEIGLPPNFPRSLSQHSDDFPALGVMVRPRQPPAGPVELGVNHEILHHGQLIVYANALGRAFPASWAAFGL
jgi:hypothetical protein